MIQREITIHQKARDIEGSRFVSQRPRISGKKVLSQCSIEGKLDRKPQTLELSDRCLGEFWICWRYNIRMKIMEP